VIAQQSPTLIRRLWPLGLLAAAAVGFIALGGNRYLSVAVFAEGHRQLSDFVVDWGYAAPLAYVVLYGALVALAIPTSVILTIAGGVMFGTWLGGICAVIGATLGATGLFLAARAGLGGRTRWAESVIGRFETGFRADAFNYLLVLRLVPAFPFWLVNLVPALLGVRLRSFVLATLLGIMPGSFIYAGIGNGLASLAVKPDLTTMHRPGVLFPILGLAALALLPVLYRHRRGKGTA
jgi:uncharacterized membrane protein YdjX (TVP38/TMEM64 family)